MRAVFMGTPDFAVPSLNVTASEHQLLGVVTQPDRPRGRGQRVAVSPVKQRALELGVPVWQPERVTERWFVETLRSLGLDVIIVVAFGQKIPTDILRMPKHGCINVHASLLPAYRGAAPIHRAITAGDVVTGVTTMLLEETLDAGDILMQRSEPIRSDDTAGTLHDRLMVLGAALLQETLRQVEAGTVPRRHQDTSRTSYARKLTKAEAAVDWSWAAADLERFVRGMNPWPGAFTYIHGEMIKLWRSEIASQEGCLGKPGEILSVDDAGILVACGQGSLRLTELQRRGSRRMAARELANGLRLEPGCCFGGEDECHGER